MGLRTRAGLEDMLGLSDGSTHTSDPSSSGGTVITARLLRWWAGTGPLDPADDIG